MLPLVLTKSLELFIDIGSKLFSIFVLTICSFFTASTFVSVLFAVLLLLVLVFVFVFVLVMLLLLLLLLLLVVVLVVMMLVLVLRSR